MDFVLDRAAGGLGPLRFGMDNDEAAGALDGWRQQPGPRGLAARDSGLSIAPGFGGSDYFGGQSRVIAITLGGPPSAADRVLFDTVDLFAQPLEDVVGQLRGRGYDVYEHNPNLYGTVDTDVRLELERRKDSGYACATMVHLVARPSSLDR